jgi:5-hydroxyisourate hydrolase-like protein (transthyretin family)
MLTHHYTMQIDEDAARAFPNRMMEKVLDQLPASRASKVKVSLAIDELNIERQLSSREVDADGNAMINQVTELQLSAMRAAFEIKVSMTVQFRICSKEFCSHLFNTWDVCSMEINVSRQNRSLVWPSACIRA